jgi:hypothetical protein
VSIFDDAEEKRRKKDEKKMRTKLSGQLILKGVKK